MADDRLINHTQGEAIVAALQAIAASGLSIRIDPARASGDEVATITINGTAVTLYASAHSLATVSAAGLMSAEDKEKLNGASFPVTVSGASVSFASEAAGRPLDVIVRIEPAQSGSGEPSPDNVRPIAGWTGAVVTRTDGDGQNAQTVTASFGEAGTVYGGTLDVARGLLTVDRTIITVTSAETWYLYDGGFYTAEGLPGSSKNRTINREKCLCSHFVYSNSKDTGTAHYRMVGGRENNSPLYYVPGLTTVDGWKAWLDGLTTPLRFVYPLDNPIQYQLAPQQITTLLGTNAVTANCGPVDVTHWPGTGNALMEYVPKIATADLVYKVLKTAYSNALPSNALIADDTGALGAYVECPSYKLSDLLAGVPSNLDIVHPAFMVNGTDQASHLYVGKYQASLSGTRVYSTAGNDPATQINLNTLVQYARNKGARHHVVTAAEWALRALVAKKHGITPGGNNNFGGDITEGVPGGVPTFRNASGRICRVATGTGPVTWSDTGDLSGVYDLNGNVIEWVTGAKLINGVLYVIPWNNAALAATDLSAESSAWRAVDATATTWNTLFLDPSSSSATANSVKLDFVSNHWQWQKAAITDASNTSRSVSFGITTIAADVSAVAALYLRAMAFAPESGSTADNYGLDKIYAANGADGAERILTRGGTWNGGTSDGIFALDFNYLRGNAGSSLGGRIAYYE